MRAAIPPLIIAILLACVAGAHLQLRSIPREDPLGRRLLYLPTAEYLNLLSMGNRGLMADMLYLWSIQYYTRFKPDERFLYLDKIYSLITDLDPLYRDPYRVGAMIMLIEAKRHPEEQKEAVLNLLEKGIAAIPDDYVLAEEAAWKCRIFFKDDKLAAHYAGIAASRPNAPHWTKRFYGHLSGGTWPLDQSINYWFEVLEQTETDYQRMVSRNHIYDLIEQKDRQLYEPFLEAYRERHGRCPETWQEIIDSGVTVNGERLTATPEDFFGVEYGVDADACAIIAYKKIKED